MEFIFQFEHICFTTIIIEKSKCKFEIYKKANFRKKCIWKNIAHDHKFINVQKFDFNL